MSAWKTKRTFGLSMPMPNAVVATTTSTSSSANPVYTCSRSDAGLPAW